MNIIESFLFESLDILISEDCITKTEHHVITGKPCIASGYWNIRKIEIRIRNIKDSAVDNFNTKMRDSLRIKNYTYEIWKLLNLNLVKWLLSKVVMNKIIVCQNDIFNR